MSGKKTFIFAAALVLLVALAPFASAQTATGTTTSNVRGDGISGAIDRGSSASYFVYWQLCWTGPAVHPSQGEFSASLAITAVPDWIESIPAPAEAKTASPTHPYLQQTEECSGEMDWEFKPTVKRDAPYGEEGTITATVTVTAPTDPGTYDTAAAGDYPVSLTVRSGEAPAEEFPGANTTSPSPGTNGNGNGNDSGESPGVAPLTLVITLAALAVLRRRQ